jgi:hypothetical protein
VDLQEDIDVGMNRSTDGGQTWEPMKVIMDMGEWGGRPQIENGIGDPAVLVDRHTNTIWVAALCDCQDMTDKRGRVDAQPPSGRCGPTRPDAAAIRILMAVAANSAFGAVPARGAFAFYGHAATRLDLTRLSANHWSPLITNTWIK